MQQKKEHSKKKIVKNENWKKMFAEIKSKLIKNLKLKRKKKWKQRRNETKTKIKKDEKKRMLKECKAKKKYL